MTDARPSLLIVTTVARTLEAFLTPFAHHYRAMGWRVEAASGGPTVPASVASAFNAHHDVPLARTTRALVSGQATTRIRDVVTKGKFDIVHVHTPVASFATRMALRHLDVPVVYTAHGFHFFPGGSVIQNALFAGAERIARDWTTALVVLNAADRDAASDVLGYAKEKVFHMPGIGVDITHIRKRLLSRTARAQLRDALSIPDGHVAFVYPAEFNTGKRHRDLLEAFARVRSESAVLLLAGEGKLRRSMETLASQLGVSERTRFLGFRVDIMDVMQAADAMVFPSEREGLPRSILEAMCVDLPVIGAAARGVVDMLDGSRGVLVPVGDIKALSAAMQSALENGSSLRACADRARAALPRYDVSEILHWHTELYASLLPLPRAGAAL